MSASRQRGRGRRPPAGNEGARSPEPVPAAACAPDIWQVERLVAGGHGLARLADGRIGFVPDVAPGERLVVHEARAERGTLRARRWELLTASAGRVVPPCPVAGRCGGCDWMHLTSELQLDCKRELLRDALRRTGGVTSLGDELRIVSVPPPVGYRSRIRVHVAADGRVGMHARGSNDIAAVARCLVGKRETDEPLRRLGGAVKQVAALRGHAFDVELRVAPAGPPVSLFLGPGCPPSGSAPLAALRAALPSDVSLAQSGDPYDPAAEQRWPLPGGIELRAPPQAFTQVNWPANLELVTAVVAGARARAARRFVDAYCGAGNFALSLAAAGLEGVGVEREGAAIRAAARAARAQGLGGVSFEAGDAASALTAMAGRGERPDLCVLDPPRQGARPVLPALTSLAPAHLALCGCDPVTLARDLRSLLASGYRLVSVVGFDMFPQTHHLETLVWLERSR